MLLFYSSLTHWLIQLKREDGVDLIHSCLHTYLHTMLQKYSNSAHKFDVTSLAENWLRPGSTVVEHSTHNPEIEGSDPSTGTQR